MKIYHLSHTDLDGYGCQFVLDFYFKNCAFFNSNYGREINDTFAMILNKIDEDLSQNESEKFLVLISDLNLTTAQCADFEKALEGKNAKILLLDHHQSGEESAKNYAWYFLDSSRCATKILYDFFAQIYGENEALSHFVSVINAVDIWLKDDAGFELGKVCLGMISGAREINRVLFCEQNTQYMFFLLQKAMNFVGEDFGNVALDDALHGFKKEFFGKNERDTLGNLIARYMVRLLSEHKERFSIDYAGHRGILTYNIGNTSVIGNDFLVQNPEFDFFLDVNSRKSISFRANGNVDVSEMARALVGGGGHKNASGGLFASFKDSSDYAIIKAQITDLIKSKELEEVLR